MLHPQMFDDDDPVLARVRDLALALPGAAVKVSHGRPAFYTTKVFAYYGWSRKVDEDWVQHPQALVLLLEEGERQALLHEDRAFVPPYVGPSGWVAVDLDPDPAGVDWDEVTELLDASFRRTAPPRRVAELDARS